MASTVALVLLPRYLTLAGASTFTTSPVRIEGYEGCQLFVWRGRLIPTGTFTFFLQESMDQQHWIDQGTMGDPGSEQEATYTSAPFTRLWLRIKVVLDAAVGDFPTVSCYAVGFLVSRRK